MTSNNAVVISATVYHVDAGKSVEVFLQGSNDMENWRDIGAGTAFSIGYSESAVFYVVTASFVRLRYTMPFEGISAVLAAGVTTSNQ